MKTLRFFLCLIAMNYWVEMKAQTIPVGFPFFDDELRRSQLKGEVNDKVSFMIRPVHPEKGLGITKSFEYDKKRFPSDSFAYKNTYLYKSEKNNIKLKLLPVLVKARYNQHHPYGWNDGAMVPSKGLQWMVSGGVYGKYKFIEAQLRPEYVNAQNLPFTNPPERPRSIDLPERMGQNPYKKQFLGQSYVKAHIGPFSLGYSTENITWGGGYFNNIILSNNAPGFGHYTLNTNKPISTQFGTIEGQMIGGKLNHSGFTYPINQTWGTWPPQAGDVVVDTAAPEFHTFFSGLKLVFQPKWLSGLFLGASRIVQIGGEPSSPMDYINYAYLGRESQNDKNSQHPLANVPRNQIVAVSARYLLPESHAEVYFEMGREDWWGDLEDLITRPFYSTVWMAGLKKLYFLENQKSWLEFLVETTNIKGSMNNFIQPNITSYHSFYMHGNQVGWTHHGQVLGAGIGPGSNMQTIGVSKIKGMEQMGLYFERVNYNEDLFYGRLVHLSYNSSNPLWKDYSKRYVDWGFKFLYQRPYFKNNLLVSFTLHLMRTYNFNWVYDPDGVAQDFRFPGINVWSGNLNASAIYFF